MLTEDKMNDLEQAYHESTTRLPSVTVTVHYSGAYEYEYEDCTLEEAMAMAKEDFRQERKNTYLDLEVDEVREGSI